MHALEPGTLHSTFGDVAARPKLLQPFEQFHVPATYLLWRRLQHLSATQCRSGRGTADDKGLAEDAQHRFIKKELRQAPGTGSELIARVEEGNSAKRFNSTQMQAKGKAMLDGPIESWQVVRAVR